MAMYHPHPDEYGKPVLIKKPSKPTPLHCWDQVDAIATITPNGKLPTELNGIPFVDWQDAPTTEEAWNQVGGQLDFNEPPFLPPQGMAPAAGVAIQESDGRIWLVSPTNGFAGYTSTLPKGRVEGKVSLQVSAIREAFEEAGLQVQITGFLTDALRSQTYTRYYLARRVGGNPASMGWESQAVHLVPRLVLDDFLTHPNDQQLLKAIDGLEVAKYNNADFKKTQHGLRMEQRRRIQLLELGGEGGELRLFLEQNELGIFSYVLEMNSSESSLFDGEDFKKFDQKHSEPYQRYAKPLVIDWAGALRLLDDTGWAWPMLFPLFVHPSIFDFVITALKDRFSHYPNISFDQWESKNGWGGWKDAFDEDDKT